MDAIASGTNPTTITEEASGISGTQTRLVLGIWTVVE